MAKRIKRVGAGVRGKVPLKKAKKNVVKKTASIKTKKNYTVFVLDESSSMWHIKEEARAAVNEQIKDIKENVAGSKIDSFMSLVKFGTTARPPVYWNKSVDKILELSPEDYCPSGMTAMLDAVGLAIDKLQEEDDINDKDTSVLFVIVSDGAENASQKESYTSIAEKISECQKTDQWTFTYSGANQDLSRVASRLNIPIGNTQRFEATRSGVRYATSSRKVSNQALFDTYKSGKTSTRQYYSGVKGSTSD